MFKFWKNISFAFLLILFSVLNLIVLFKFPNNLNIGYFALFSTLLFLFFAWLYTLVFNFLSQWLFRAFILQTYNRRLYEFANRIRFSFSMNDFIELVKEILEEQADFRVQWIHRSKNNLIYSTPGNISVNLQRIQNFLTENKEKEGLYFLDENLSLLTDFRKSRAVAILFGDYGLTLFSRYLPSYDANLFVQIAEELKLYLKRVDTIEAMFNLSSISREWDLLAETQQFFLPDKLENAPGLDLSVFYKPLSNVSGDYYDVIPIDDHQTLILVGDVSGKGLSAALIMGIVMNTVKIVDDKTDLKKIIHTIDEAIKQMGFEGKFTAAFVGLYNQSTSHLSYISSGMPDPSLIYPDHTVVLPSECRLLGIFDDLGEVTVLEEEMPVGSYLLIASDGLTEAEDENGVQLGETELFDQMLIDLTEKRASEIIESLTKTWKEYQGDRKVRDDVTFLVVKAVSQ